MAAIDLGTATTVSWALGEAEQTVVLTVTLPDGTTDKPTVAAAAGTYSATVATPQAGRYLLSWSKAAAPAKTYSDLLDVWPEDPRFIVPLEEMISALRARGDSVPAGDKSDMRLFIAAATPVIEDIVGAVLVATKTQTADGGKTGIALWERADEVTSVTVNGQEQTAGTDYVVNLNAGIVYAGSTTAPSRFTAGRQNVVITYRVGSTVVPPNVRLATIELVRHQWQMGRQGRHSDIAAADQQARTPSGFAVPKRVLELCAPHARKDGFG